MFPIFLTTGADTTGMLGSLLLFVPVLALMYFMMIRPQKKKEKQQQSMRNSLEIGDSVTTIGGIVGRVVALKEDTVVLETANERNKIRFKRWAVQEVERLTME